ncbi:MAG: hypothetical protein Q7R78_01570 [bacterium]|nr:hypothetical protein [bacterium]
MKKSFFVLGSILSLAPLQSFALTNSGTPSAPSATLNTSSNLSDVVTFILGYFDKAILLILGLCVVLFVWGVYQYFFVKNESGDGKKGEAGMFVMYGVIGFFIILSFWGLVSILKNTFGFDYGIPSASNIRNNIQLNGGSNSTFPGNVNTGGSRSN